MKDYSVGQAARILNTARSSIRKWINTGILKSRKMKNGKNIIHRSELERFFRKHQIPLSLLDQKPQPGRIIKISQMLKAINLTRSALTLRLDKGELPSFKLPGGSRRVLLEHFKAYVKKHNLNKSVIDKFDYPKVLFIGEKLTKGKCCEETFAKQKLHVKQANNTSEAGIMVAVHKPKVIVVDLTSLKQQPKDFINMIYECPECQEATIIGGTNKLNKKFRSDIVKSGFHGYIKLPTTPSNLARTVNKIV